ncbi:hypothetical protein [Burkholderia gladioli]|uniref:hypothetical protein n=1 Tax=Burkholderia gladioli TaxID=28095 RepID=UPI0038B2C0CE
MEPCFPEKTFTVKDGFGLDSELAGPNQYFGSRREFYRQPMMLAGDSPRRTRFHSHSIINRSPKPAWLKDLAVIEISLYRRFYRQKSRPFAGAGLRSIGISSISTHHT